MRSGRAYMIDSADDDYLRFDLVSDEWGGELKNIYFQKFIELEIWGIVWWEN